MKSEYINGTRMYVSIKQMQDWYKSHRVKIDVTECKDCAFNTNGYCVYHKHQTKPTDYCSNGLYINRETSDDLLSVLKSGGDLKDVRKTRKEELMN